MALRNFFALTPERVLAAVEQQGVRGSGYAFALNSFENRVYDVELEDGQRKIVKFYRPGRWSRAALLEEHQFLRELDEAGVGCAPYERLSADGATLGELATDEGPIYFAIATRVRGRVPTEVLDEDLPRVAASIAELHAVGASGAESHERGQLGSALYGRAALDAVIARGAVPDDLLPEYRARAEHVITVATRTVDQTRRHRIHADCHIGNLLWKNDAPLFVDLDDFVMGPPVQDLWLLAGGNDEHGQRRLDILCDAYQRQRNLPPDSMQLVPVLRALRVLRYAGWVASRYDDPAFLAAFPDFRDRRHWQSELHVLDQIVREIG